MARLMKYHVTISSEVKLIFRGLALAGRQNNMETSSFYCEGMFRFVHSICVSEFRSPFAGSFSKHLSPTNKKYDLL